MIGMPLSPVSGPVHDGSIEQSCIAESLTEALGIQDVELCLGDESDSAEPQSSMPSQPDAAADVHDLTGVFSRSAHAVICCLASCGDMHQRHAVVT